MRTGKPEEEWTPTAGINTNKQPHGGLLPIPISAISSLSSDDLVSLHTAELHLTVLLAGYSQPHLLLDIPTSSREDRESTGSFSDRTARSSLQETRLRRSLSSGNLDRTDVADHDMRHQKHKQQMQQLAWVESTYNANSSYQLGEPNGVADSDSGSDTTAQQFYNLDALGGLTAYDSIGSVCGIGVASGNAHSTGDPAAQVTNNMGRFNGINETADLASGSGSVRCTGKGGWRGMINNNDIKIRPDTGTSVTASIYAVPSPHSPACHVGNGKHSIGSARAPEGAVHLSSQPEACPVLVPGRRVAFDPPPGGDSGSSLGQSRGQPRPAAGEAAMTSDGEALQGISNNQIGAFGSRSVSGATGAGMSVSDGSFGSVGGSGSAGDWGNGGGWGSALTSGRVSPSVSFWEGLSACVSPSWLGTDFLNSRNASRNASRSASRNASRSVSRNISRSGSVLGFSSAYEDLTAGESLIPIESFSMSNNNNTSTVHIQHDNLSHSRSKSNGENSSCGRIERAGSGREVGVDDMESVGSVEGIDSEGRLIHLSHMAMPHEASSTWQSALEPPADRGMLVHAHEGSELGGGDVLILSSTNTNTIASAAAAKRLLQQSNLLQHDLQQQLMIKQPLQGLRGMVEIRAEFPQTGKHISPCQTNPTPLDPAILYTALDATSVEGPAQLSHYNTEQPVRGQEHTTLSATSVEGSAQLSHYSTEQPVRGQEHTTLSVTSVEGPAQSSHYSTEQPVRGREHGDQSGLFLLASLSACNSPRRSSD